MSGKETPPSSIAHNIDPQLNEPYLPLSLINLSPPPLSPISSFVLRQFSNSCVWSHLGQFDCSFSAISIWRQVRTRGQVTGRLCSFRLPATSLRETTSQFPPAYLMPHMFCRDAPTPRRPATTKPAQVNRPEGVRIRYACQSVITASAGSNAAAIQTGQRTEKILLQSPVTSSLRGRRRPPPCSEAMVRPCSGPARTLEIGDDTNRNEF